MAVSWPGTARLGVNRLEGGMEVSMLNGIGVVKSAYKIISLPNIFCKACVLLSNMLTMFAMNTSNLIDNLGGTTTVARICGVTPQAVSQWRRKGIPRPWMLFLAQRMIIARADAKKSAP